MILWRLPENFVYSIKIKCSVVQCSAIWRYLFVLFPFVPLVIQLVAIYSFSRGHPDSREGNALLFFFNFVNLFTTLMIPPHSETKACNLWITCLIFEPLVACSLVAPEVNAEAALFSLRCLRWPTRRVVHWPPLTTIMTHSRFHEDMNLSKPIFHGRCHFCSRVYESVKDGESNRQAET